MTAGEDDLSGQVLGGKYRLQRRLGAGAFGAVYEATHLLGKATRAVKVIHAHHLEDPKASRMFLKEAQAVMRVETPRAVVVHDVDREPTTGRLYIVMEMLRGETLRDYLRRESLSGRGLPVAEAMRIAIGVCEALRVAHEKGVVHRDLKPSNVMMVPGESGRFEIKVVDFGIARLHSLTQSGESSTEIWAGTVGTPPYMSPEQCRGLDVDGRSDLYSLGVMMYEMLAGRLPFRSNTPQGYAVAHLTETPLPLATACPEAGIPAELDRLVLSLLAKRPEDRPRNACEVLRALSALDAGGASKSETQSPSERTLRRGRLVAPAVAALAALAAAVAWFAWSSRTPTPSEPPPPPAGVVVPVASFPPDPSPARDVVEPQDAAPQGATAIAPDAPPVRSKPGRAAAGSVRERPAPRTTPAGPQPAPAGPDRAAPASAGSAQTNKGTDPAPRETTVSPPARVTPPPAPARASPVKKKFEEPWDPEFDELDRETR